MTTQENGRQFTRCPLPFSISSDSMSKRSYKKWAEEGNDNDDADEEKVGITTTRQKANSDRCHLRRLMA